MSKYIHFTQEQKEQAVAVDLEMFLQSRGERLLSSGREKRLASDHSITIRGNEWYDHAQERGGHAVSFVQHFYHLSYPEAVTMLLSDGNGVPYPSASDKQETPKKPFALPEAHSDARRVFAYLVQHRKIDRSVVSHFMKAGLLYEDARYHNAVFVGLDEDGVPRHAHKRSTNSSGKAFRVNVEGSDPKHCFHHIGTNGSLYVFEAPIDLMSHITLYPNDWQKNSYVSCCGTSAVPVMEAIRQIQEVDTVYLCYDNDTAGHAAGERVADLLAQRQIHSERLVPVLKDWNDELTEQQNQEMEVSGPCQTFC